jgi:hypothetical protein
MRKRSDRVREISCLEARWRIVKSEHKLGNCRFEKRGRGVLRERRLVFLAPIEKERKSGIMG